MLRIIIIVFVIIIAVCLIIWYAGRASFNNMIKKEKALLFSSSNSNDKIINEDDLIGFPELLKTHLVKSGIIGKKKIQNLIIKQKGNIKIARDKKWMPFKATQYFSTNHPGFIWTTKIFPVYVRDKFLDKNGEVMVSLMGLKKIDVSKGDKVDQGSLLRYLGELVWIPSGLVDKRIHWTVIDSTSLRAGLTIGGTTVNADFHFGDDGLVKKVTAQRYYESAGDYILKDWYAVMDSYEMFEGTLLPNKGKVFWKLEDEDYEYFNFEINEYNIIR